MDRIHQALRTIFSSILNIWDYKIILLFKLLVLEMMFLFFFEMFFYKHDTALMRDYAKIKNGSFYYIKELEIIEECKCIYYKNIYI